MYCRVRALNNEDFVWILKSLLENIQELQDFLIDVNSMYLTPEEIYIDNHRIVCCVVPFYTNSIWDSLRTVLQFLLHHLDSQDTIVTTMAYRFFCVLSEDDCSMERLWALLYEKREKQKFFKNVENEKSDHEERCLDESQKQQEMLLDQLFLKTEKTKNVRLKKQGDYLKKLGYLFPGAAALFLLIYLIFNSWTLSSVIFSCFIAVIVLLIGLSIFFYWKWGRNMQEINPLLESVSEVPFSEELDRSSDFSEDWEDGTVILSSSCEVHKTYLVRTDTGEQFLLKEKSMIIGKKSGMAQILIKEPAVSRIHAMVIQKENFYYLQDLNSKNGTYVNGKRLENQELYKIRAKDEINIANVPLSIKANYNIME